MQIQASLVGGYDNNVNLDAERKGDQFIQEDVHVSYRGPLLAEKIRFRLAYDVLNNNYFEVTEQNFLSQEVSAGADVRALANTWIQLDYDFNYLYFMNDEDITSLDNTFRVGILQKINQDSSFRAGYSPQIKSFDDRKLRQGDGVLSADTREDNRQTLDAEYKRRFQNKSIVKLGLRYFYNDSNDFFHDYYDYNSYKFYVAGFMPVFFEMDALIKFSYQNDDYASRSLVDSASAFQNDDIYQTSVGFSKKICPNASLIGIYSYRQKVSNEPSQSYSGTVVTLGLHTSF